MAKKKKSVEKIIEKSGKEMRTAEKELEDRLTEEVEAGREMIDEETREFKKKIKSNPLEYVAGAFIVGFIIGKILK